MKYALQGAVMTCTPVTGYFELFDRSQVRITSAKILQRERQRNEKTDSIEGFRVLLSRSFGFFDKFFSMILFNIRTLIRSLVFDTPILCLFGS